MMMDWQDGVKATATSDDYGTITSDKEFTVVDWVYEKDAAGDTWNLDGRWAFYCADPIMAIARLPRIQWPSAFTTSLLYHKVLSFWELYSLWTFIIVWLMGVSWHVVVMVLEAFRHAITRSFGACSESSRLQKPFVTSTSVLVIVSNAHSDPLHAVFKTNCCSFEQWIDREQRKSRACQTRPQIPSVL